MKRYALGTAGYFWDDYTKRVCIGQLLDFAPLSDQPYQDEQNETWDHFSPLSKPMPDMVAQYFANIGASVTASAMEPEIEKGTLCLFWNGLGPKAGNCIQPYKERTKANRHIDALGYIWVYARPLSDFAEGELEGFLTNNQ